MDHHITRRGGDDRIKFFLKIKDEILNSPLFNSLSPHAQAYLGSAFVSFVFEKPFLDTLGQNVGANGLRIYFAATPNPDPARNGEPTLIIYPCEITPNPAGGTVTNQFASADPDSDDSSGQHPGLAPTPFTHDTFDGAADNATFING